MDANFWHNKWKRNEIGFHETEPNQLLVTYFHQLNLKPNSRIFLPLCGKTSAIKWILDQGHQVVGAELSEMAIQQLFDDLNISPQIEKMGRLTQYSADNLTIFVGDIFELRAEMIGRVNAIFDRAALVALPYEMRVLYTKHLQNITRTAPQLLVVFTYDQTTMAGPPFSISVNELTEQYGNTYSVSMLQENPIGLRGNSAVTESIWILHTLD